MHSQDLVPGKCMKEGGLIVGDAAVRESPSAPTTKPSSGQAAQRSDTDAAHVLQVFQGKPSVTKQRSSPEIKWSVPPAFQGDHLSPEAPPKRNLRKQLSMGSGQLQLMAQAVLVHRTPQHSMSGTPQQVQSKPTCSRTSFGVTPTSSDIAKAARQFSLNLTKHNSSERQKSNSTGQTVEALAANQQGRCLSSNHNAFYTATSSPSPFAHPPPISTRASMSRSISNPAIAAQPPHSADECTPSFAATNNDTTEQVFSSRPDLEAAGLARLTLAPSDMPTNSEPAHRHVTAPPPQPSPSCADAVVSNSRSLVRMRTIPAKQQSECWSLPLPRPNSEHPQPQLQASQLCQGTSHLQQLAHAALSRQESLKQSPRRCHSISVQSPRSLREFTSGRASSSGTSKGNISRLAHQFSTTLSNKPQKPHNNRGQDPKALASSQKKARPFSLDATTFATGNAASYIHHPPPIRARAFMSRSVSSPAEKLPQPWTGQSSAASPAPHDLVVDNLNLVAEELLRMTLAPTPADVPNYGTTAFDLDATPPHTPPNSGGIMKVGQANPHPGAAPAAFRKLDPHNVLSERDIHGRRPGCLLLYGTHSPT